MRKVTDKKTGQDTIIETQSDMDAMDAYLEDHGIRKVPMFYFGPLNYGPNYGKNTVTWTDSPIQFRTHDIDYLVTE